MRGDECPVCKGNGAVNGKICPGCLGGGWNWDPDKEDE
jgi:DnaJ-class molecular chaperone